MALLKPFATMALISGALLMLLPEGSLRKTAALVMGLLLTLCWAEGLLALFRMPEGGALPDTALSPTGVTIQSAAEDAAGQPTPEVTREP